MQNISFLQDLAKKTGINLGDIFGNGEQPQPDANSYLPDIPLGLGGNIPTTPAALPDIPPPLPADGMVGLGNFGLGGGTAGAVSQGGAAPGVAALPQQPVELPVVAPRTTNEWGTPAMSSGEGIDLPRKTLSSGPSVLPPIQIAQSVPTDRSSLSFDSIPTIGATPETQDETLDPYRADEPTPDEKEWRELNDDKTRYRPPTYQNTDPKSAAFGTQSSDPDVVKSWGKNNAARIDEGGAKRNKKWSLLEKIGSAALGWAQGGLLGGIQAGTDRNYFPKLADQQRRQELLPRISAQQAIEKGRQGIVAAKEAPKIAREKIAARFQEETLKQKNRIEAIHAREAVKGEDWKTENVNGLLWKHWTAGPKKGTREKLLKEDGSGEQERDLLTTPTDYTIDGQKYTMTGAQAAGVARAKLYQDATLAQGERRLDQGDERLRLDREQFENAKSEFARVQALREAAQRSNDVKAAEEATKQLVGMMQWASERLKDRKIDQGQHDILMGLAGDLAKTQAANRQQ